MKKELLVLFIFFALSTLIEGAPFPEEELGYIGETGPLSDWRAISVMVALVSVMFIVLAYLAGKSLDMPDLRAWATSELSQAMVTVLIVLFIVVIIGFANWGVSVIVNTTNLPGITCAPDDVAGNCAIAVADGYLTSLIEVGKKAAVEVAEDNVDAMFEGTRRFGGYAKPLIFPIPLLQLASYGSFYAHRLLDAERYSIVFEYWVNVLSILYSQLFFINEIAFKVAPALLGLGIVARAFFVTRKLGGLLMAVALGVMFILPMMYVFNWVTLNVTLFGDKAIGGSGEPCPEACKARPPLFYSGEGAILNSTRDLIQYLEMDDEEADDNWDIIISLKNGSETTLPFTKPNGDIITIHSCEGEANNDFGYCPIECRELPYPLDMVCTLRNVSQPNNWTEKACAHLPEQCKVIRSNPPDDAAKLDELCPSKCRVIPPLKSNCDVEKCLDAPHMCRVTYYDALNLRPGKCADDVLDCMSIITGDGCTIGDCLDLDTKCKGVYPGGLGQGWTWVSMPNPNNPAEIKLVRYDKEGRIAGYEVDEAFFTVGDPLFDEACSNGAAGNVDDFNQCMLIHGRMSEGEEACMETKNCFENCGYQELNADIRNCIDSYDDCKSTEPNPLCGSDALDCPVDIRNPEESCVYIMPRPEDPTGKGRYANCELCLMVPSAYIFNPPVEDRCAELCSGKEPPKVSPGTFTKMSRGGMVGRTEIKNISAMMLPAFILPLLNIAVTIMFIKTLSPMLGGDIEIPGMPKII